jgi:hypothetical protein
MDEASWNMIMLKFEDSGAALKRAGKIKRVIPDVCKLEEEGLFTGKSSQSKFTPKIQIFLKFLKF